VASQRQGAGQRTYEGAVEPSGHPTASRRRGGPAGESGRTASMGDSEAPVGELHAELSDADEVGADEDVSTAGRAGGGP
jgi:hypothetical protein